MLMVAQSVALIAAGQSFWACSAPVLDRDMCMRAGFGKVEKRVRTTAGGASGSVRNLRIREDTAKYLLNLDANSAHYDPKSRSMREDPQPYKDASEKSFAGTVSFCTHGKSFNLFFFCIFEQAHSQRI